jgi:hypothetical protein
MRPRARRCTGVARIWRAALVSEGRGNRGNRSVPSSLDTQKIDLSGSTNTLPRRCRMSTLDEITKEKQRISEALARVDIQREKLASQFGELEATERVLARYGKGTQLRQTASARTPATATKTAAPARRRGRPAHDNCKSRWRQAQFVEPRRPGPGSGNRQDAAGNRCCMQGRSPQPCRRRPFPPQAGGPHRRARWETLRHTVNEHGATGRALILG